MEALIGAYVADPVISLAAGMIAPVAIAGIAMLFFSRSSNDSQGALSPLFERETFEDQIEATTELVQEVRAQRHAERTEALRDEWNMESREEALERVAAVMRGSAPAMSYYSDVARYLEGEGFIMIEEHAAIASAADLTDGDFCEYEDVKLLPAPSAQAA